MTQSSAQPPICPKKTYKHEIHGDVRQDPYYWLNQREDPEVIQYLKDENEYTQKVMSDTADFQDSLFHEMKSRIKEDDSSVPYFLNGYWYYSRFETGKEYPLYCRKKDSLDNPEEILLNVNEIAEGEAYCQVGGLSVSPDNQWLSFGVDFVSRRIYTIKFKNLFTGEVSKNSIPNTTGGSTWAKDSDTVFYSTRNEQTLRSDRVHRYRRSDGQSTEVYHERDETFNTGVSKTKSRDYLIIVSSSTLTTEYRYLDANDPEGLFHVFQERIRGMEYGIDHYKDRWYVVTNWEARNFRLMSCPLNATHREDWVEVIAHREETLLEGIELFNDFMVREERRAGLTHVIVEQFSTGKSHTIEVDEPAYTIGVGNNPEYDTNLLRYGYTSLITPTSTYEYNMVDRSRKTLKQQEVLGGYDREEYRSERLMIPVRDGAHVPVSIVYHKSFKKDGKAPVLLYGYGSYGHSIDPTFSSVRMSLLKRGFAFAIAHIRGGEEMGRTWYEDGKLLKKKNSFYDFIDCGQYLVNESFTSEKHLYAMGGSAGGLLMGAVINMAPKLFNGAVAAVPFVDVVTTMLDESIPLTTGEFDEWGNPKNEIYYEYIKSYSPYDNIEEKEYPNLLITTGLHDSQVQYWEPAKWVARLREMKTDNNLLLLQTEMAFGHGGASGRFERLKEVALEYAFLLKLEGISK